MKLDNINFLQTGYATLVWFRKENPNFKYRIGRIEVFKLKLKSVIQY